MSVTPEKVARRRRMLAALDELKQAGLLNFRASVGVLSEEEPLIDVWSLAGCRDLEAPDHVSQQARVIWDGLRSGRLEAFVERKGWQG